MMSGSIEVTDVPLKIAAPLVLALVVVACGPPAPNYLVTATPIEVGAGLRFCVAVDAMDAGGVWWWQPGRSGCSTRSTGPGVFRGENGLVVTRPGSHEVDARFRVGLIRMPNAPPPDHLDVHLVLADGHVSAPATGARVATERWRALDPAERP